MTVAQGVKIEQPMKTDIIMEMYANIGKWKIVTSACPTEKEWLYWGIKLELTGRVKYIKQMI